MIELKNVTKKFDENMILKNINFSIKENETFGLIGTNGAGKSTILRIISGILKVNSGEILLDDENIEKNPYIKSNLFYISDEQYYFPNANTLELINYYTLYYKNFDTDKAKKLFNDFGIDVKRKIKNFSKGMKKQVFIVLALCANTKYILLDETFDGLDPVMRQLVKSLIAKEMTERNFTPIIASHNLRELEDICDHILLLHKGDIILSDDLDNMKLGIHRVQFILNENSKIENFNKLNIVKKEEKGKLKTLIIKGKKEEIENIFKNLDCLFYEMLPLTLEEIFINQTEEAGYDFKSLIM